MLSLRFVLEAPSVRRPGSPSHVARDAIQGIAQALHARPLRITLDARNHGAAQGREG